MYQLTAKQVVWLSILQCTVQGVLIPLFATFLTSKRDRSSWLKAYVIVVNALCLAQTVMHTMQGFDAIDGIPPRVILMVLGPVLTAFIATLVQAFFIYRCWRIFKQRVLPILPFLCFSLISFVSGTLLGVSFSRWPQRNLEQQSKLSMVWVFSSFALDFCTTLTTIIYMYRVRKSTGNHRNVISLVWQIIWASAAPPLILMLIIIVNGYIVKAVSHTAAVLSIAMTAKFFVLSLMINLVGRGYIRRQFERPGSSFLESPNTSRMIGGTSSPVFAPVTGVAIELTLAASLVSTHAADLTQECYPREGDKDPNISETTIINPDEPINNHTTHVANLAPTS